MPFLPVSGFEVIGQFRQGAFDDLYKIAATACLAAQAQHGFLLRVVVSDRQHLAKGLKAVRSPLDHLIGGLTRTRKKHFHRQKSSTWHA